MILILSFFIVWSCLAIVLKKQEFKKLYTFILFGLFIISFTFIPSEDMDLYRHYLTLENFRNNGWEAVLNYYYFDSLPIYAIYFYIISQLKINAFLPGITAILVYGFCFLTINKVSNKYNIAQKGESRALLCLLFTLNLLNVMSGIRNALAFSIFSYFIYIDLVERKKRILCWVIYFLLIFLHSSILMLIAFRILLLFYTKRTKIIFFICILFWNKFYVIIIYILSFFPSNPLNSLFLEQIEFYSNQDYIEFYQLIMNLGLLVCISLAFYFFRKYIFLINFNIYNNYISLILFFTWGSISSYNLFIRLMIFLILNLPVYVLFIFNEDSRYDNLNCKKILIPKKIIRFILIYIATINLFFLMIYQYRFM